MSAASSIGGSTSKAFVGFPEQRANLSRCGPARFPMSYQPIENYGVIGDLHTVALVGMDGSIDFMCFPHFDSPSIFAAMLDDEKGGRFKIAPHLQRGAPQAALPAGHQHAADALPLGRRRGRSVRLHAGGGKAARPSTRPARQDGARRSALPHDLCARLRLRTSEPSHRAARRRSDLCAAKATTRRCVRLRAEVPLRVEGGAVDRRVHAAAPARPPPSSSKTPERVGRIHVRRARLCRRGLQGNDELLARLDSPIHLPRSLARDGESLRAHAQAAHLASRTAPSSPRRPLACPRKSAACATGTIGSPGFAMPRSPSTG